MEINVFLKANLEFLTENGICFEDNPFDYFKIEIEKLDEYPQVLECDDIKREILKTDTNTNVDPEILILNRGGLRNENLTVLRVI